jgi:hypothetical protein
MTKRFRVELTELELECLFIVADEGCERADAGAILSMGEGFANNRRAAQRARDKLAELLDARDAADRLEERAQLEATARLFPPSFLDDSHDPEREDCACDWCEEGRDLAQRAPAGQLAMTDVSRPGVPMPHDRAAQLAADRCAHGALSLCPSCSDLA